VPRLISFLATLICLAVGVQVHAADRLGKELANAFIGGCLPNAPFRLGGDGALSRAYCS
jgi:hypothetical protein